MGVFPVFRNFKLRKLVKIKNHEYFLEGFFP